jgi:hypothetical protein
MFPLLKTGGLADVTGAPGGANCRGVDTRVLLPGFPAIRNGVQEPQVVASRETFAGPMTLLFGDFNGVGIYLIDAPHLYDRPGNPYHDQQMQDYPDNVLRFALLSWVGPSLPAVWTRSGGLKSSTPMTGTRASRRLIWPPAATRPNRCLRCTTLPIRVVPGPAYGGDRFTVVILPDARGGV